MENTVKRVMQKVPRELFVPKEFYNQVYSDTPLPIPGGQTISAPHMHVIVLSELKLKKGERVLEVGSGSGILLAYIYEFVGKKGKVIGIEFNKETYDFGKGNLKRAGYDDVLVLNADGSMGYPKFAPYDKIVISAAAPGIPKPLIEQLKTNGIMLAVIGSSHYQTLIKIRKTKSGKLIKRKLLDVVFVPLKGEYGWE